MDNTILVEGIFNIAEKGRMDVCVVNADKISYIYMDDTPLKDTCHIVLDNDTILDTCQECLDSLYDKMRDNENANLLNLQKVIQGEYKDIYDL